MYFTNDEPVHIFTDGALEGDDSHIEAGLGAVLVRGAGNCLKASGYIPSEEDVMKLGRGIHQLEILPVIMACIAFDEEVRHKPVFFHVDNAAAQAALINAGSTNHLSNSLVYLFLDLEQRLHFRPWISRVSSHSNISDGPSRGSFEELHKLGAECFLFPQEVLTFIMTDFKSKHMINDANA